ncbi:MAG: 5-formyltetrahydrofolate cyclo-ligase [Prevotella sp.]|nr:5-formyltetrahydrofolate cyclo-ligase [Prevotella sp.]
MRKDELRELIRKQKRQFTPAQLEELSLPIMVRLKVRLAEAQTVMAYYSLPDEVCTHQLIDELVAEGKTVLLPKVIDNETMELRRYTGRHDLREGAFHIMEPVGALFTDFSAIDIALIPGIAFDARGYRLGRGRGYYDRFLCALGVPPKLLGLCFDFQKVDEVPVDEFDIPVDEVF